jgi:exodeoxyribonuclease III
MLKLISYNLNGIRAAVTKDLASFIKETEADIYCFQEIKADEVDIDTALFNSLGYNCYWYSAQKKGYSGVGIISKKSLENNITKGNGMTQADYEGRTITAALNKDTLLVNTYFPSGSSGEDRQAYKMEFLAEYMLWLKKVKKQYKNVIVVGDYNICHREIDIHDPKGNKKNSGFLPEEREWMEQLFTSGFTDSFRHLHPEAAHQYSWWSYRANARNNNKGWRIDYIAVTDNIADDIKAAYILPEAKQSDHCPIGLEINI